MKNRAIYIIATMLLLVSCYPADSYIHFIVNITDNIKAVITIDTSRHRHWWCSLENEEITILSPTEENRSGVLNDICDDISYALYPADKDATLVSDRITTTLPEYREFSAIAEPIMVAQDGDFEEASAMLCIDLSSESDMSKMLKSITLSSALHSIAGRVEIDCARGLAMTVVEGGSNSVTIPNIDIMLDSELRSLYIAMPPVAFADGELCLILEFEDGSYTIALPQLALERGVTHTINCRF